MLIDLLANIWDLVRLLLCISSVGERGNRCLLRERGRGRNRWVMVKVGV
jgi:hypothetical protein